MFPGIGANCGLFEDQTKGILKKTSLNRKNRELNKKIEDARFVLSCVFLNFYIHQKSISFCRHLVTSTHNMPLNPESDLFHMLESLKSTDAILKYPEPFNATDVQLFGFFNFYFYSFEIPTDPQLPYDNVDQLCCLREVSIYLILLLKNTSIRQDFGNITLRMIRLSFLALFKNDKIVPLDLLNAAIEACPLKHLLLEEKFIFSIYNALSSMSDSSIVSGIIFMIWKFFNHSTLSSFLIFEQIGFKIIIPLYQKNRLTLNVAHFLVMFREFKKISKTPNYSTYQKELVFFNFYKWFLDSFIQYLSSGALSPVDEDELYNFALGSIISIFHLVKVENLDVCNIKMLESIFVSIPLVHSANNMALLVHFYVLFKYFDALSPPIVHLFENYLLSSKSRVSNCNLLHHASLANILFALLYYSKSHDPSSISAPISDLRSFLTNIISKTFDFFSNDGTSEFCLFILFEISSLLLNFFHANHFSMSYMSETSKVSEISELSKVSEDTDSHSSILVTTNNEMFNFSEISLFIVKNCDVRSNLFKKCAFNKKPTFEPDVELENIANVFLCYFYFLVPIKLRLKIFNSLISTLSATYLNNVFIFRFFDSKRDKLYIRRNHCFRDGFLDFTSKGYLSRLPWLISFIDEQGNHDPGVDGGGLYRQFISKSLSSALDPRNGLFSVIDLENGSSIIYPSKTPILNPLFLDIELVNFSLLYKYIGNLLGRFVLSRLPLCGSIDLRLPLAFWSQIIPPVFSSIELKISELREIDPSYLFHLLQLRHLLINALISPEDLAIYDHASEDTLIDGTNINSYIASSIKIKLFNEYFVNISQEFFSLVPKEIFSIFTTKEIMCILDGRFYFDEFDENIKFSQLSHSIDLKDWRSNTVYGSPYSHDHPTIELFWKTLSNWNNSKLSLLLKFCTGYSSPPYLGFSHLTPLFCINFGGNDLNRLPTSSTCVNMISLPGYQTMEIMDRLLGIAIQYDEFLLS